MTLKDKYEKLCSTKSDINEHLPTLKKYADECDHITEMGVRGCISTIALLMGKPFTLISYDIVDCPVEEAYQLTKGVTNFKFIKGDTLKITIEQTDLLFIDTLHNYTQLSQELALHGNKVDKYIIFHDTTSFEHHGESYTGKPEKGIWKAIEEFIKANPEWEIEERYTNNNGLTILKKM
jgi:cephalosporin hydroxylase